MFFLFRCFPTCLIFYQREYDPFFTIGNIVSSLGGLTIQSLRYVFGWKLPYRPGVLTKKTCWNDQETERDDDDDDDDDDINIDDDSTNKNEMVHLV